MNSATAATVDSATTAAVDSATAAAVDSATTAAMGSATTATVGSATAAAVDSATTASVCQGHRKPGCHASAVNNKLTCCRPPHHSALGPRPPWGNVLPGADKQGPK